MQPGVTTRLFSTRKCSKQVSKQTGDMNPDVSGHQNSDVCSEAGIGHQSLPPTPGSGGNPSLRASRMGHREQIRPRV